VKLLVDLTGGTVVDHTDAYPNPMTDLVLELNEKHLQALGGVNIPIEEAKKILDSLGFKNAPHFVVPYWRTDIHQEADLIEEVLRIYGYDKIPASLPNTPPPKDLQGKSTYTAEEKIKDVMIAAGFDEQITEPLTNEDHSELEPIKLENSLNADKTMLRTTMRNSLLAAFTTQQKYRKTDIRIFEIGKIYFKQNNEYKEEKVVAGVSSYSGNSFPKTKGVLEELFLRLNYQFNQDVLSIEPLNETTYYFEVKLSDILKQPVISFTQNIFTQPPHVILQDFSLHAAENIKVGDVIRTIQQTSPLVFKIKLGETPQKMKDGGKSIFLNITFFSPNGPISNQNVESEREKIREVLEKNYQIRIR
jgi:phenylalanyl-tRNA synthetase beta subunit